MVKRDLQYFMKQSEQALGRNPVQQDRAKHIDYKVILLKKFHAGVGVLYQVVKCNKSPTKRKV
jgi:hypothetical protein